MTQDRIFSVCIVIALHSKSIHSLIARKNENEVSQTTLGCSPFTSRHDSASDVEEAASKHQQQEEQQEQ
jgi:hypothetical protein